MLAEYSVNPNRVFLIGVGEGRRGGVPARSALSDRVAGLVALNGAFPADRVQATDLRVLDRARRREPGGAVRRRSSLCATA